MTVDHRDHLLRWYPEWWRRRYGDEMLVMIEDGLAGRPPSFRLRVALFGSGVGERMRGAGLIGAGRPPADRGRAGALAVLVGWLMVIVAGGAFAKFTERWQESARGPALRWAAAAYVAVEVLAVAGGALTVVWVAGVIPALGRALRSGAWPGLRRPVIRAASMLVLAAAGTVAMARWAGHLSAAQRNGDLASYDAAFVVWGVSVVAVVVAWGIVAVKAERRLPLSAAALRLELGAGVLLGLSSAGVATGMAIWWVTLALRAPWVIAGGPPGAPSVPWAWPVGLALVLGLAGAAVAGAGATRIAGAVRKGL